MASLGAWRMLWPPGGRSWCRTESASTECGGTMSSCPGWGTSGWWRKGGYLGQKNIKLTYER